MMVGAPRHARMHECHSRTAETHNDAVARTTRDGQLLWKVVFRLAIAAIALLGAAVLTSLVRADDRVGVAASALAGFALGAVYILIGAARDRKATSLAGAPRSGRSHGLGGRQCACTRG